MSGAGDKTVAGFRVDDVKGNNSLDKLTSERKLETRDRKERERKRKMMRR